MSQNISLINISLRLGMSQNIYLIHLLCPTAIYDSISWLRQSVIRSYRPIYIMRFGREQNINTWYRKIKKKTEKYPIPRHIWKLYYLCILLPAGQYRLPAFSTKLQHIWVRNRTRQHWKIIWALEQIPDRFGDNQILSKKIMIFFHHANPKTLDVIVVFIWVRTWETQIPEQFGDNNKIFVTIMSPFVTLPWRWTFFLLHFEIFSTLKWEKKSSAREKSTRSRFNQVPIRADCNYCNQLQEM